MHTTTAPAATDRAYSVVIVPTEAGVTVERFRTMTAAMAEAEAAAATALRVDVTVAGTFGSSVFATWMAGTRRP